MSVLLIIIGSLVVVSIFGYGLTTIIKNETTKRNDK